MGKRPRTNRGQDVSSKSYRDACAVWLIGEPFLQHELRICNTFRRRLRQVQACHIIQLAPLCKHIIKAGCHTLVLQNKKSEMALNVLIAANPNTITSKTDLEVHQMICLCVLVGLQQRLKLTSMKKPILASPPDVFGLVVSGEG